MKCQYLDFYKSQHPELRPCENIGHYFVLYFKRAEVWCDFHKGVENQHGLQYETISEKEYMLRRIIE